MISNAMAALFLMMVPGARLEKGRKRDVQVQGNRHHGRKLGIKLVHRQSYSEYDGVVSPTNDLFWHASTFFQAVPRGMEAQIYAGTASSKALDCQRHPLQCPAPLFLVAFRLHTRGLRKKPY